MSTPSSPENNSGVDSEGSSVIKDSSKNEAGLVAGDSGPPAGAAAEACSKLREANNSLAVELAALEHDRSILKAKLDRRMRELDAVLHNTLALEHAARSRMAENHQIHLDIRVLEDQIAQGNQRIAVAKAKAAQLQSQPIDLRPAVGYERYAKAEVRPRNGDWVLMDESGTRMGDDEIIYLDTHFDQMRDERWNVPLIWIAPNDSIANTSQKVDLFDPSKWTKPHEVRDDSFDVIFLGDSLCQGFRFAHKDKFFCYRYDQELCRVKGCDEPSLSSRRLDLTPQLDRLMQEYPFSKPVNIFQLDVIDWISTPHPGNRLSNGFHVLSMANNQFGFSRDHRFDAVILGFGHDEIKTHFARLGKRPSIEKIWIQTKGFVDEIQAGFGCPLIWMGPGWFTMTFEDESSHTDISNTDRGMLTETLLYFNRHLSELKLKSKRANLGCDTPGLFENGPIGYMPITKLEPANSPQVLAMNSIIGSCYINALIQLLADSGLVPRGVMPLWPCLGLPSSTVEEQFYDEHNRVVSERLVHLECRLPCEVHFHQIGPGRKISQYCGLHEDMCRIKRGCKWDWYEDPLAILGKVAMNHFTHKA